MKPCICKIICVLLIPKSIFQISFNTDFCIMWHERDFPRAILCIALLRSERAGGMCTKLHTVAASNNRDHARNLSYYCLLALHI